jgi:predicted phage replisome organizer
MILLLNSGVFCLSSSRKKYSWLKLQDDFFAQPYIKKLRLIAGGDTFVIIYLKLQLMSIKNEGHIYFEGVEDNLDEELALCLNEKLENVKMTLLYLEKHGLIELVAKNTHMLPEVAASIGKEGESTARVRKHRAMKKQQLMQFPGDTLNSNADETLRNVTSVTEVFHSNGDETLRNVTVTECNVSLSPFGNNSTDEAVLLGGCSSVTETLRNTNCNTYIEEEEEEEEDKDNVIVIMRDDACCSIDGLKAAAQEKKGMELNNVVDYYKQVFGMEPTELVVNAIAGFLVNMDKEIVLHAFKLAAAADKLFWSYVEGILENWISDRIFTVQDLELHERERKLEKAARRTGSF